MTDTFRRSYSHFATTPKCTPTTMGSHAYRVIVRRASLLAFCLQFVGPPETERTAKCIPRRVDLDTVKHVMTALQLESVNTP
ncbi:hypothetical protein J6590_073037 [Homalodisca vitripennis]|nr:hypothetical protein J6590_073037 [Homalodisca vitripennis]